MKTIQIPIPEGKKVEWVNDVLTLVDDKPQDIINRIKSFEDAYTWCNNNGYVHLVYHYKDLHNQIERYEFAADLLAYLKLRIITIALNEGWNPTLGENEHRWYVYYHLEDKQTCVYDECLTYDYQRPLSLLFKSSRLAEYAAKQFYDLYTDFCGRKKGGEE